ncbi:MAG: type II secretion system protein [Candidatus Omnitrophica bacterium]|nr:type II secretion system protein [Candidatus Omnitrophota bacterium]MDE2223027.1 type II secretion system protein [Candidatus Omnitrophota bacterium]
MACRQGFTLIELVVVLIIVGVVAAIALPNMISASEQTKAQMARNNLYAIAAAQQKYFEDNGIYCTQTSNCADTTDHINTNLHLSFSDKFSYSCTDAALPYQCTAGDGTDTLTLSVVNNGLGDNVDCAGPNGYCPP